MNKITILSSAKILSFESIRDFLSAICQKRFNTLPSFHILSFTEMDADTPTSMPPYQKNFFQINYIESSNASKIKVNTYESTSINRTIYFISPEHIYSWKWAKDINGFAIYFDKSFLDHFKINLETEFYDLFDLRKENILDLSTEESQELKGIITKLNEDYIKNNAFKIQILQTCLLSLLYKSKQIYVQKETNQNQKLSRVQIKYSEFKNLLKNNYITQKSVKFYANQLFIGPNYLNEICKKVIQKSAKHVIQDHILYEAKIMLHYSNNDIAEIGFYLGFKEATHFNRFFKRQTGVTPKVYRNKMIDY